MRFRKLIFWCTLVNIQYFNGLSGAFNKDPPEIQYPHHMTTHKDHDLPPICLDHRENDNDTSSYAGQAHFIQMI